MVERTTREKLAGMFWIAFELNNLKIGLITWLSLSVKKLTALTMT